MCNIQKMEDMRLTYCCLWCWRSWLRLEYTLRTQRMSLSVRTSGFSITFSANASNKAVGQNMRFSNWDRKRITWTERWYLELYLDMSYLGKAVPTLRMWLQYERPLIYDSWDVETFVRVQLCVAAPVCCSICLSWRRRILKWQWAVQRPCSAALYRTAAL